MLVARRFVVSGRVQGVGFRWFVEHAARTEGIRGWVANLENGTVEVRAEGEAETIARFEAKLRQGPTGARVDRVTVDEDVPGQWVGFVIRHDQR
jgi:acylphosphatase